MYYVSDGNVYVREGDVYRNVAITAKDKVITHRELESISVKPGKVVVESLEDAVVLTMDELIRKFNISEENPVKPLKPLKSKDYKQKETDPESEPESEPETDPESEPESEPETLADGSDLE